MTGAPLMENGNGAYEGAEPEDADRVRARNEALEEVKRARQRDREKREKESAPPELEIYNAADFAGQPVPPRQWLVPDIIPMNRVTLLYGNGGEGKSLTALQLEVF